MQRNNFMEFSLTSPNKNNLLRLKTFSQSFDDLTIETLYSKWKKARKIGTKPHTFHRSVSLLSCPNLEALDENANECCVTTEKTTLVKVHRQIIRHRGWTICSGEIIRGNSHTDSGNVGSDSCSSGDATDSASISVESDCGVDERKIPSCSPTPSVDSLETSEDDVFVIAKPSVKAKSTSFPGYHRRGIENLSDASEGNFIFAKPLIEHGVMVVKRRYGKENRVVTEITTSISGKLSRENRSLSDGDQSKYEQPIKARSVSGRNYDTQQRSLSYREPRELHFLKTAEMARRYLENSNVPSLDDVWQKREVGGLNWDTRHKRPSGVEYRKCPSVNNNIHGPTLGQTSDRSGKRYTLGCTYALVSQPINSPQQRDNQTESKVRRISAPACTRFILDHENKPEAMESGEKRPESEEKRPESAKDGVTKNRNSNTSLGQIGRSRSFGDGTRRAATMPRLPRRSASSLSSRKASELRSRESAKDLLENITNTGEKSEKERVDIVEKAFDWIRKELAELRAQDKDIMRMFTKIQAGIRHMKFDESLLESAEDECNSSTELSQSFSQSPSSNEASQIPRKAM